MDNAEHLTQQDFDTSSELTFLPGPEVMDVPIAAVSLQAPIVRYPANAIAESILAFPGMELLHGPDPVWDDWRARWRRGRRFITLDMTVSREEGLWVGSRLTTNATEAEVLRLWEFLLSRHRGIWLQDGSFVMHLPASFAAPLRQSARRRRTLCSLLSKHLPSNVPSSSPRSRWRLRLERFFWILFVEWPAKVTGCIKSARRHR